ncbi:hypothetical protein PR048_004038 [Dryococelus australis]|uniref:Uncharacterized protein n=1 Tax=Dryococelus australis TaxID=614101 RepID=A0ABQ9I4C4_9NEOP|nr:hypothetical protein PR048_004038 [Dryococelus australis]
MVRLLASPLAEQGSIPGGVVLGFSHVGILPDDAAARGVYARISRFLALSFRRCSILSSVLRYRLSTHFETRCSSKDCKVAQLSYWLKHILGSVQLFAHESLWFSVVSELQNRQWLGQMRKRHQQRVEFPPASHSGAAPYSSRFTLIGSEDLDFLSVWHHAEPYTEGKWCHSVDKHTEMKYLGGSFHVAVRTYYSDWSREGQGTCPNILLVIACRDRFPPRSAVGWRESLLGVDWRKVFRYVAAASDAILVACGAEVGVISGYFAPVILFPLCRGPFSHLSAALVVSGRTIYCMFVIGSLGAAVAQWLAHSPPTKASPLLDFRVWETSWTMRLAGGFSRGTPVSPTLVYQRRSILGYHCMSCLGTTGTYGSQLESPSLGGCCLALGSLPISIYIILAHLFPACVKQHVDQLKM